MIVELSEPMKYARSGNTRSSTGYRKKETRTVPHSGVHTPFVHQTSVGEGFDHRSSDGWLDQWRVWGSAVASLASRPMGRSCPLRRKLDGTKVPPKGKRKESKTPKKECQSECAT
ncbi:hypothetical protein ZHAS_00019675 [Anopheles sinensis]|uniref:Uncharacterized protein n=1 Tax=Anopheles sinensis TaxID=74873 RepID=A0A084WN09_ANOSI|nr:hypothetical protein ZHAS_00019675 [Anopheles sinensis]